MLREVKQRTKDTHMLDSLVRGKSWTPSGICNNVGDVLPACYKGEGSHR